MRSEGGFSLIEVLAGLLILSVVITTSLAVFYERQRRLLRAEETMLVYQAVLNEAELMRKVPYTELAARNGRPFESDLEILSGIPDLETLVSVVQSAPSVKSVKLELTWREGMRTESVVVIRTDTGGENLW